MRHTILSVPQATILRDLQWKRMIAVKKNAIFHCLSPLFLVKTQELVSLFSENARSLLQDEQLTSKLPAQSGGNPA